jgi:hypothetical protein
MALLVASIAFSACGESGDGGQPAVPGGADSEDVEVIEAWVDELRAGHLEAAAGYFALPSVAQNGIAPIRLRTRAAVIAFNRSLPCGAKLVRARPVGRYVAATFRLTERPGPGVCGSGTGGLASTAFVIRDGKIVQWRRLPDPGGPAIPDEPEAPTGPIV